MSLALDRNCVREVPLLRYVRHKQTIGFCCGREISLKHTISPSAENVTEWHSPRRFLGCTLIMMNLKGQLTSSLSGTLLRVLRLLLVLEPACS